MDKKQRPVAIERVSGQFAQWREHKSKRDRIPEHLWRAAVEVAQRHGVHATSRALRLEHSALRRRVEKTARHMGDAATFIELENTASADNVGCIVELEKSNGTRMRICVRDGAAVDWARMKEAFLGA